jgi:hypothetical protein
MIMSTVMVRVDRESHGKLKELSARLGKPMPEVLAAAIEQYRRTELLKATNRGYARLRRKTADWRQETKERGAWDATLADGLGEE